jgi:hypothetical protein
MLGDQEDKSVALQITIGVGLISSIGFVLGVFFRLCGNGVALDKQRLEMATSPEDDPSIEEALDPQV